jgi:hypothetical protein
MGTTFDMGVPQEPLLGDPNTPSNLFSVGVPPGSSKEIAFNYENEWATDSRFSYDPIEGLLSVPRITGGNQDITELGGWDVTDDTLEKIVDNKGIIIDSSNSTIRLIDNDINRVILGYTAEDSVFKIRNEYGEIVFDSGAGTGDIPYLKDYVDSKHIELELMKINFQSISWAQFAIYEDFSTSLKRANPDLSPNLAVIYKSYLYNGDDLTPNKSFGFISKTYENITTIETGTSTSVGLNYLQDTSKNWYNNQCKNLTLKDSLGSVFNVDSNNNNILTIVGTPTSGVYSLIDKNPSYTVVFCTLLDSIWGGYGSVKIEVSFNNGVNWQTFYETGVVELRQATVAILNTGVDYVTRFTLTNDSSGKGPIIYKFLICTDPSPWRY